MNYFRAYCALAIILLGAILNNATASPTGKITGRIVDLETEQPLCNADLWVKKSEGDAIYCKSNGEGYFTFIVNAYGMYEMGMSTYSAAFDKKHQNRFDITKKEIWGSGDGYLLVHSSPEYAWTPSIMNGIFVDARFKDDDQQTLISIENVDLGKVYIDRSPTVRCQVIEQNGTPMAGTIVKLTPMQGSATNLVDLYLLTDQNGFAKIPLLGFEMGYRWRCESFFPRTIDVAEGPDHAFFYQDRTWKTEPLKSIKWLNPIPPITWQPFVRKDYNFKFVWPQEKDAISLNGTVKYANSLKAVKHCWVRLDTLGVSNKQHARNSSSSVNQLTGETARRLINTFSINTLYNREFKSDSGTFLFGHLQPGITLSLIVFDPNLNLGIEKELVINDYKNKNIEIIIPSK